MNVKSVEISNKLGQSLPGLQIYPKEDPKELVAKQIPML